MRLLEELSSGEFPEQFGPKKKKHLLWNCLLKENWNFPPAPLLLIYYSRLSGAFNTD